jgi:SAM-dependent methyltransferase
LSSFVAIVGHDAARSAPEVLRAVERDRSVMRLVAVKRHWERLGRRDPFWAALTIPDKRHGRWAREQFFRSGADEMTAVLRRAERLGLDVSRRRALDFGCGAGRVTQAMAEEFQHVDGVDISAPMVRAARRYNRHGERCTYHLNVAADLKLFGDARYALVYSTLVLQHMEPRDSKTYIGELMRVLAPDGLLVFQLPSHRTGSDPPADARRTPIAGPLPVAAFNARLTATPSSLSARAGDVVALGVTVENVSPHTWPALPGARDRHRITLGNHWLHGSGEVMRRDDARCPLSHDIAPGSRAELILHVTAPAFDGDYWVELDLVQENVNWFAERGSETLRVPCQVTGGLPGRPPPPRPTPVVVRAPKPEEPPFRERHPRIFRVLRATRLRDLYWIYRHSWDAFKVRRDRSIERMVKRLYEPYVPPLINWWNTLSFAPRMEMHCVPRAEIVALVAEHGGRVVDVEEELMPGGYLSCRYWVVSTLCGDNRHR